MWELPLALCVGYRQGLPTWPILNAPIRDYAGGIVKTIASGMRDDVDYERRMNAENLMNAILSSDVLMLLADANILSEQAGPNGSLDKIEEALARDIDDIFMSYVETEDSEFTRRQRTVILMLTKCDSNLIPEQLAADDFQGLMARAATPHCARMRAKQLAVCHCADICLRQWKFLYPAGGFWQIRVRA